MTIKADPRRYYRTLAALFITFAAARRGISTNDYITGFNRGLFNACGDDFISEDAIKYVRRQGGITSALRIGRAEGEEAGLRKLWALGELEETLFGK
jgi:hypothetical protein